MIPNYKNEKCSCCLKRLDSVPKKSIRRIIKSNLLRKINKVKTVILQKQSKPIDLTKIKRGDFVCGRCISFANNRIKDNDETSTSDESENEMEVIENKPNFFEENVPNENVESQDESESQDIVSIMPNRIENFIENNTIYVNYPRTYSYHTRCFVCKRPYSSAKLTTISMKSIVKVFLEHDIFIPKGSRCCTSHLDEHLFLCLEAIQSLLIVSDQVKLSTQDVKLVFESLKDAVKNNSLLSKFHNLENLTDEECMTNTGFNKQEFQYIVLSLSKLKNSILRSKSQALAVYLYWLKTGLNQQNIASIFSLTQQDVSRYCDQVRKDLVADFVSQHLGPKRLNRQEWLEHNTPIVKELFLTNSNQFSFIADGTYCYCQKSSNNTFQQLTFSGQKKRHLIKPFVICASDGTILDVYGPYGANMNDAKILSDILKNNNELKELLLPNDVVLLDRGFRDCISELKNTYKLRAYYPSSNYYVLIKLFI
jgi:hypothetical protein